MKKTIYGISPPSKIPKPVLSQKPLVIIEVDIGETESEKDTIIFFKGDNAKTLAVQFC